MTSIAPGPSAVPAHRDDSRAPSTHKLVYYFGQGHADGSGSMRDVLGGKGAGLAEMTRLGIPVPPGFTISSTLCMDYLQSRRLPPQLLPEIEAALRRVEAATGKRFGDRTDPLLLSVRSGARVSMPGMMETVLNLGLNDETVEGLAAQSGNPRFAWDSYRRFVQMYGSVVFDVPKHLFEERLAAKKELRGVTRDIDLPVEDLQALVREFKAVIAEVTEFTFPEAPMDQLRGAIEAVFESWYTRRATDYRKLHGIPDSWGTAVNVQTMVYGNLGEDSATGVLFSRDPSTGERVLYGEFLVNAQGEDVVSGARTPEPIARLRDRWPRCYEELERMASTVERHYRDMQDMEFTIERGTVYMLQTRRGQRTGQAAVRIACEMVDEGLIDRAEAIQRVPPRDLDQLLHPTIAPDAGCELLATGLPASPGAASGIVVFDADEAERVGRTEPVILVRRETSPEDFHGMVVAKGILTARGGMTSHAAVVARGMGKPCVAGASALEVREVEGELAVGDRVVRRGEWLTLDGSNGKVYLGRAALVPAQVGGNLERLLAWADEVRALKVRANADTPADARRARGLGAEGIGLCRTEHMFFEGERLTAMREMIVAQDRAGRERALAKLLPMQRGDFEAMFRAMEGMPVTIRLLDPPLHEFLPKDGAELESLAGELGVTVAALRAVVNRLHEQNPMLGLRGCRLGIVYPEITEMQARAIFEAACTVSAEGGRVMPEVMIPLVGTVLEFRRQAELVHQVAGRVFEEWRIRVPYLVGTMIELPRAALTADEIAGEAQFFSFGTNDLTQTTWGLSRDDAELFLPQYLEQGILPEDPFQVIDRKGVGKLMRMGVQLGRGARPELKIGICGEHGGEPESIAFCHSLGLDYVSCSPFRVPIARLAAAQAALAERGAADRTRETL